MCRNSIEHQSNISRTSFEHLPKVDPTNIDRLADEFANAGLAAADWVPAAAYRGLAATDDASDSMPAAEFRGLGATDGDGDGDADVVGNAEWLEVRSKKDLSRIVLKGRDGSLEYVLPGGDGPPLTVKTDERALKYQDMLAKFKNRDMVERRVEINQ